MVEFARPTGTVTFLFTDIEGSTRLWADHPIEMEAALERHDEILRDEIEANRGYVFSTAGDGFAAAFSCIGDAVAAATEAQLRLQTEAWPPPTALRVRMGLHTGEARERGGDYFGSAVNKAARIMSAGHGGQILLSASVAAVDITDDLVSVGRHVLKDLHEPEELWQVGSRRFPPLRMVDDLASLAPTGTALTNVPTIEPLVGRDDDVAELVDLVRSRRLVTITGPGGVGKSCVALVVARQMIDELSDGCWLVELAPLHDSSGLVAAVAAVLPVAAMPTTSVELVDLIGSREVLLLLDNCEHLVEGVASLVARLLALSPRTKILCTSREALAIGQEHTWPLQPLGREAAVELFNERARAVRPDMAHSAEAAATVVERLDRLPLAIELAAARVLMFSTSEIAAQLDDRFRLLSMGGRETHPRHRTLAAMVDWSHDHLETGEQKLFRRLGIFAGTFTRDAAVQIACLDPAEASTHADDLDHLVRRSMVVADVGPTETRYRLLETLRHYALDRLNEADEIEAVARRHAEWYAQLTKSFEAVASPDETLWLARGIAELDNFRSAVRFAMEQRDTDLTIRVVGGLWRLHDLWNPELLDWARQTATLPGAASHPDVGYVHVIVAALAWVTGDREESELASERALESTLAEDAWFRAWNAKVMMLLYQGRFGDCRAMVPLAQQRLKSVENRTELHARLWGAAAYAGHPAIDLSPAQVVADADATQIPGHRAFVRAMVALGSVKSQPDEATKLLREALEIVEPGLNRRVVSITNEVLLLATGAEQAPHTIDTLESRAARTLGLVRDYPLGLGFALIGLLATAHRMGRDHEAAVLAGFISTHYDELALPARSAEVMAGRPIDQFATPTTRPQYLRGQSMTMSELYVELERLAEETSADLA